MTYAPAFAFDKSARSYDADGRLHVTLSNISKATVNPYRGSEIPGAEELGLDADRVYYLLRDPDELAKAAPTFNNLPILIRHVPVSADAHMPELVIGSTGTDAAFMAPYLTNSLVIWASGAIAGIETREQQELSSAYRYKPDMTPGTYKGLRYDGIMRDIVGNHVALVEAGRAGPDVVVGDSQLRETVMLKSRRALMLQGALSALIVPRLAQDQKFDVSPYLVGVNAANFATTTKRLPERLLKATAGKIAADEGLDVDDVIKVIGAVQGMAGEPDGDEMDEPPAVDAEGDMGGKILAYLKGKIPDDVYDACAKMAGGEAMDDLDPADVKPEGPEMKPDDKKDDKPAMDAKAIEARVTAKQSAIRQAERAVRPYVGEIETAMDSAENIYRYALTELGVEDRKSVV